MARDLNSVKEEVRSIIGHLWSSEASNFARKLAGEEPTDNHVFRNLMKVSNQLDGTNTDPDKWAREQFAKLFEEDHDQAGS